MIQERFKVSAEPIYGGERVEGCIITTQEGRAFVIQNGATIGICEDERVLIEKVAEVNPATIEPIKVTPIESFGWICPNCSREFVAPHFAYCFSCGQALDWGDSAKPSGESKTTTETE